MESVNTQYSLDDLNINSFVRQQIFQLENKPFATKDKGLRDFLTGYFYSAYPAADKSLSGPFLFRVTGSG